MSGKDGKNTEHVVVRNSADIAYFSDKAGLFKVICDGQYATVGMGCMDPRSGEWQKEHSHPNEQLGFVLMGECELIVDGKKYLLKPGCTYNIPPNASHAWHPIGNETFYYIDFFTPRREDLRSGFFDMDRWRVQGKE